MLTIKCVTPSCSLSKAGEACAQGPQGRCVRKSELLPRWHIKRAWHTMTHGSPSSLPPPTQKNPCGTTASQRPETTPTQNLSTVTDSLIMMRGKIIQNRHPRAHPVPLRHDGASGKICPVQGGWSWKALEAFDNKLEDRIIILSNILIGLL